MAIKPILKTDGRVIPQTLFMKASDVTLPLSDELTQFAGDMLDTMSDKNGQGVGIAAPQLGASIRMIMIRGLTKLTPDFKAVDWCMLNPEITFASQIKVTDKESCLSYPGRVVRVSRSKKIKVKYSKADGTEVEAEFDGYIARVIQHEIDHLNGRVIGLK